MEACFGPEVSSTWDWSVDGVMEVMGGKWVGLREEQKGGIWAL